MNQKIRDLLKVRFGKVKAVSGGSYRIPCPTCDPKNSKKMKRYVSPGWSDSRCFICEQSISLQQLFGENVVFDRSYSDEEEIEYKYAKIVPYNHAENLANLDENDPAVVFLKKDQLINFDYYDSIGIRYVPSSGGINISFDSGFTVNTANSIFFPVFGKNKEYVGWQLRFVPGTWNGDRFQFMRYMHLFPKGDHLFNYHIAKQYKDVLVVEGAKKALKLANSVATLGKGISATQKQLIQEWRSITLVLDGEDSTQELARDICDEFRSNGRACVNIDLREYGFESPDETSTDQLKKIILQEHAKQRERPRQAAVN